MNKKVSVFLMLFVAFAGMTFLSTLSPSFNATVGIDWDETFRPAAHMVLEGESPYSTPTFRNVPWVLLPLLPFAVLPEPFGGNAFFVASLFLYAFVAKRIGASPLGMVVFLLSPPVLYGLKMSNVDILVLLGFILHPVIGLFLVLIKPQMGIMMFFFWFIKIWKEDGWMNTLKVFAPVTIATTLAIVFFDYSPLQRSFTLVGTFWNASLWPWAIPIGFLLFAKSLRSLSPDGAMASSPFLSPYLAYHSWVVVLVPLLKKDFELVVVVLGMWFVFFVRLFG